MTAAQSKVTSKIEELTTLCAAARRKSPMPRYSQQIKDLVRVIVKSGVSVRQLCQSTGIAKATVAGWVDAPKKNERDSQIQVLTVSGPETEEQQPRSIVLSLKTSEFEVAIYSYDRVAS